MNVDTNPEIILVNQIIIEKIKLYKQLGFMKGTNKFITDRKRGKSYVYLQLT